MITTGTSWFRGNTLYTGTLNDTNLPTDAPSILLIPQPFTSSDAGTYTCSPVSTFTTMLPPGDTIILTASGEYIAIFIVLYSDLYKPNHYNCIALLMLTLA